MFTLFTRNCEIDNEYYDVAISKNYSDYFKSKYPPKRTIGKFETREELIDLLIKDRPAFKLKEYENYFNSLLDELEYKVAYLIDNMDD